MSPMAAPRSADPAPVMDRDAWEMHPAGRTGLEFYDLSHTFGPNAPLWPYFDDVEIKRIHYHAKSGVLSQRISTVMHCTTHLDAPAHVVEGTPYTDEVPLEQFFGTGVAVSIPKKQWEVITPEDLEAARPEIRPGDFVVINTGWHHYYADNRQLLGNGIVGFENVGGDLDKVTGRRCTFAAFPIRWQYGDGSIVRLVAIVDPTGEYRIERGAAEAGAAAAQSWTPRRSRRSTW